MDMEAARTARESLDLAFQMSNILETGLDRHTLSVLICDLGVNPEAPPSFESCVGSDAIRISSRCKRQGNSHESDRECEVPPCKIQAICSKDC